MLQRLAVLLACVSITLMIAVPAQAQNDSKDEKPDWDVTDPPGPSQTVTVDTDEGTWMHVDVSPDGETIVFDLLGDIFLMPMDGGEATALTSDLAWDMQPVFSPDGSRIAFTSDRDGGDNIWTMDTDGSDLRQVTEEDFRLLNSPVWSPDGEYIAARKHYTGFRSLGQGQVWLYHRSGGQGVKLAAHSSEDSQKELGEPAFSPDGRYLYYALDATQGDTFEYNKDANTGIFEIRRLDRETGKTDTVAGGPGGAIRPTPSPDGEKLAFVRRVRDDSVLFVQDLETGEERPVYRELDRDLQEAWAIHGVYPHMAWTPDSESIVLWAGGKIRRVDAASGEPETIAFRVEQDFEAYEALRHPVDVAPERFRTKMLRWVTVSPDGEKAVFQALGRLWVRELPDGEPERLTGQEDHFEFYPAWSADSEHIVYTTWDDQDYGTVRVVRASGGQGRVISPEPGHYVEPDFSPDGETVVYRKLSGNQLRGTDYGVDPGVYRVSASGGEAERIHDSGRQPQFGPDGERVYLLMMDERDKRRFISVNRDGHDEREHLKAEFATEFELSPDGRWVAFTERFHAYIAPFVDTGGLRDIGPEDKTMPVARVTKDAGDWLHWSGDGERLHWALGPELFGVSVEEAFAFLNGDPDAEPAEPVSEGTDLGFERDFAAPGATVAYTGGRVVTMDDELGVIDDGTVVVEGNRITAVGASDVVEVPDEAEVVDISGKTLMPGLIDVHWHGAQASDELTPEQNWYNYATLALGVTTIHDPSNNTSEIFAASELGKAGLITGPRIFSTGTILYGATTSFTAEIDEYEDAKRHLRRMKAAGAFSVKSYNQPRRDQRQQVVAAGRELDMMVVPEGGSLYTHDITMVMDGHTGVEHNLPQAEVYDDVKQLWGATEVGYTPTLVVAYGGLSGEYYWYAKQNVWEHPILKHFVPRTVLDPRSRRRETAPDNEWGHMQGAKVAAELQDAGVSVLMGAHGQREGLGAHWEMWMFEQGGMSNRDVLRTATIDAARYLGLDGDIGSVEAGKLADLVVVDGNPLADIRVTDDVHRVMVNGELYEPSTMNRALSDEERQPFWFEDCPYQPGPDLACE